MLLGVGGVVHAVPSMVKMYVDRKGSAGNPLDGNLRNPLHEGDIAHNPGVHSYFETQGGCHQKYKKGLQVEIKKSNSWLHNWCMMQMT